MRTAAIVGFLVGAIISLDRFMSVWDDYASSGRIKDRPIATIGSSTPGLEGSLWVHGVDFFTHLLLPTIALILISFATYTRYSRASLLEVMNQDYIRTARAKGLTERTVIVRHAFRNALIPIATIVAFDIGALIGGAVITETRLRLDRHGAALPKGDRRGRSEPGDGVLPRHRRPGHPVQPHRGPRVRGPRPENPGVLMTTTTPLSTGPGQHEPGVTDAETNLELKEVEGLSQGQIVRKRFFRHRGALVSMVVLALIIITAFTSVGVQFGDCEVRRLVDLELELDPAESRTAAGRR